MKNSRLRALLATPMILGIGASGELVRSANEPLICAGSSSALSALTKAPHAPAPREHATLHCMDLIAAPDQSSASGIVELFAARSPFGVAVTADGRPRWRAEASIAGLPAPSSLGAYTTYVAWLYGVSMERETKLGAVHNGRVSLGEIHENQFRIVVTAERSASVRTRSGRIVLRGTSPSAKLLAHRDVVQAVPPGLVRDENAEPLVAASGHTMHGTQAMEASSWIMPAMPPMAPMPGLSRLTPSVAPWTPHLADSLNVPAARPRQTIDLRDGDTLDLEAGFVSRMVGTRRLIMYGFNGQTPGPLLRVRQRARVTVRFRNRIDQPSTIHWHGVRLANAFDGVPGVTQDEVPPGGDFTYHIVFPDAGIYWYHPHVREDIQQELGLYGNMVVMPEDMRFYGQADRSEVLALDDLMLDSRGVSASGADAPNHALMGRWGEQLLVNGEPRYALAVRSGEIVRFFLTNTSNARTFNVSFPGARMKVVATDVGRLEREAWVESVPIAPAERWVVEVQFTKSGGVPFVNRVQALDHMYGTYHDQIDTLGVVRVASPSIGRSSAPFNTLRINEDMVRDARRLRAWLDSAPSKTLVLDLRARNLPQPVALMFNGLNVPIDWNDGMAMANWVTTGREVEWVLREATTRAENMDIRWRFRRGEMVKLRVYNDPTSVHAMAHPLHVHGQRFLVLARNGIPSDNLAWKDTALIPAGETVDLLIEMSNPGRWALHCHVAEHMGAGMMSVFEVE